MADGEAGGRRLIGIDLAWGEGNGSGCAELVRENGALSLSRLDLLYSTDEIVEWIAPERGDWVVAVDAPLVVLNETGRRAADAEASRFYGRFEAGAYPANRKVLTKYARGGEHRGEQLLRALEAGGAKLVERAEDAVAGRLAFETYPHIVMVELFGLVRTIKYKKGSDADKRRGQRQLCAAIREHLCDPSARPRLRIDDRLEQLLSEPDPILKGAALKSREDTLDGLVCAYAAAWIDSGRPMQGLGEVGAGVMITPEVRGIREGKQAALPTRRKAKRRKSTRAAGEADDPDAPADIIRERRLRQGGAAAMPVESSDAPRDVRRIALLIDCENESPRHAARILEIAANLGRVVQQNGYADWTNPRSKSWAEACQRHGIRQVQVNRTPRGKNTVDNFMSAEAAGLARSADVDAVCLVTSDSDFSGAATSVRAAGKHVYGIGSAEGHFAEMCTSFFRLDQSAAGRAPARSAEPAASSESAAPVLRSAPPTPVPPVRDAVASKSARPHAERVPTGTAPRGERRRQDARVAPTKGRRLIGIDLAWGEKNGSGCVELVRRGGGLELARLEVLHSLDEIAEWIEPERGDWVVAIDAPLVVRNATGMRTADRQASSRYGKFQAGAYPANRKLLGEDHRGGQLLRRLETGGAVLVEQAGDVGDGRLVFETYPHVVMIELFELERTIKYKRRKGSGVEGQRAGQQELADAISAHFCEGDDRPLLRLDDGLAGLLNTPDPPLGGRDLERREDLLDGLVGAYMAAWADAGRPLQGLGEVGEGVMIVPNVRGIGKRATAAGSSGAMPAPSRSKRPSPPPPSIVPSATVAAAEARAPAARSAESGVLAALSRKPDNSGAASEPKARGRNGGGKRDDAAGTRRLIGVALARGEKNASGCAELAWRDGELVLERVELVRTVDEIARWIAPERGDWIVAAGAPLVVRNETGRREADKRTGRLYGRYGADAPAVNLKRLGREHRGGRLLDALKQHRGRLLEKAAPAGAGRAVLETSAQPAMVELFGLDRAIRYRQGSAQVRRAGQRELANAIREHLCRGKAGPRLREDGALGELLHESERLLPDDALRDRGDRLEALICAYAAAWVDARQEIQALGTAGEGVTILPNARGIAPA